MKYLILLLLITFTYSSDSYDWDDSVFPPDEEVPVSEKKAKPMVRQRSSNTSSGSNSTKSGSNRVVATSVNKSQNKSSEGFKNKKVASDKKAMEDYKDR